MLGRAICEISASREIRSQISAQAASKTGWAANRVLAYFFRGTENFAEICVYVKVRCAQADGARKFDVSFLLQQNLASNLFGTCLPNDHFCFVA